MFWVALSAVIMGLTGAGDDTYAFRKWMEAVQEAVEEQVHDVDRAKRADAVVVGLVGSFRTMREDLSGVAACLEKLDRSYEVSEAAYEECLAAGDAVWKQAPETLIKARQDLKDIVTDEEVTAIRRALARP